MTKIHFHSAYDYCPDDYTTIAYPAGLTALVDEDCAASAIEVGVAEIVPFDEDDALFGFENE